MKQLFFRHAFEDKSNSRKHAYRYFPTLWNGTSHKLNLQWLIIAIALVPLILVQNVSKNMIEGISQRIIETDSYHLLFQPYRTHTLSDPQSRDTMLQSILAQEGVIAASPELRGIGIIRKDGEKTGVSIRGVIPTLLQNTHFTQYLTVEEGSLSLDNPNDILLGHAIAQKIDAHVGDTILLLTTKSNALTSLPKISRLQVTGIISTGYEELDKSWILTSLEKAQSIIPKSDQQWFVGIKIYDPFILQNNLVSRSQNAQYKGLAITLALQEVIGNTGTLYNWYSLNQNKYRLFEDTKQLLNFVMFITVILATVTLSSIMGMKVIDITVDIALLKGLGASPSKLVQQVLWQGLRYGVLGTFWGVLIGIVLSSQINRVIIILDTIINNIRGLWGIDTPISIFNPQFYLTEIPFRIFPLDIMFISLFTIALSVLASWIPARRVKKITALKIIRTH